MSFASKLLLMQFSYFESETLTPSMTQFSLKCHFSSLETKYCWLALLLQSQLLCQTAPFGHQRPVLGRPRVLPRPVQVAGRDLKGQLLRVGLLHVGPDPGLDLARGKHAEEDGASEIDGGREVEDKRAIRPASTETEAILFSHYIFIIFYFRFFF